MKLSKLAPHQTLIASLRKEGKSYREIVEILQDRHSLTVGRNTVHSFVKVRSKRPRKVYTMLENIEAPFRSPAEPQKRLIQSNTRQSGKTADQAEPELSADRKHSPFLKSFTPGNEYKLTRLSPEDKGVFERRLEREIELERQQAKPPKGE